MVEAYLIAVKWSYENAGFAMTDAKRHHDFASAFTSVRNIGGDQKVFEPTVVVLSKHGQLQYFSDWLC